MNGKYYRICERKEGKLYTLFHKIASEGSRHMPVDKWIEAEVKDVWDGSRKTAKRYTSGFHIFEDPKECEEFIKLFRKPRDLVMVECEIKGAYWLKEHSRANVILANNIKILSVVKKLEIPVK